MHSSLNILLQCNVSDLKNPLFQQIFFIVDFGLKFVCINGHLASRRLAIPKCIPVVYVSSLNRCCVNINRKYINKCILVKNAITYNTYRIYLKLYILVTRNTRTTKITENQACQISKIMKILTLNNIYTVL